MKDVIEYIYLDDGLTARLTLINQNTCSLRQQFHHLSREAGTDKNFLKDFEEPSLKILKAEDDEYGQRSNEESFPAQATFYRRRRRRVQRQHEALSQSQL